MIKDYILYDSVIRDVQKHLPEVGGGNQYWLQRGMENLEGDRNNLKWVYC